MTEERDARQDELRCIELTAMLSAYLDGRVNVEQRRRIDDHLKGCAGCRAAVDQFRTVVRLSGRLTTEDVATLDPLVRDRLMTTLQIPRRR
jgi:predicted anti-sigma-YlaC factor YlaD